MARDRHSRSGGTDRADHPGHLRRHRLRRAARRAAPPRGPAGHSATRGLHFWPPSMPPRPPLWPPRMSPSPPPVGATLRTGAGVLEGLSRQEHHERLARAARLFRRAPASGRLRLPSCCPELNRAVPSFPPSVSTMKPTAGVGDSCPNRCSTSRGRRPLVLA